VALAGEVLGKVLGWPITIFGGLIIGASAVLAGLVVGLLVVGICIVVGAAALLGAPLAGTAFLGFIIVAQGAGLRKDKDAELAEVLTKQSTAEVNRDAAKRVEQVRARIDALSQSLGLTEPPKPRRVR
jgi:hypothetical protein